MKKFISLCLGAMLVVSSTVCAFAATEETTDFSVKIVHTNDIHARVQENSGSQIIGMPKLKSVIDSYTQDADMDLVLDSGDLYHGQSFATLVKGESVAQLVKACGYDAMTAGNHDWNYGKDQLKTLGQLSDCDILTGNVVTADNNQFFDKEFLVEETQKDGKTLKVGVFGMIDPSIYNDTAPSNVEGLTFTDMQNYANKAVADLQNQNCDVIICLTHCYDPVSLAKNTNGVDVWLAGHEHIDIDQTVTTPDGDKALVVENGYYLYEAGLIELDCTMDNSGELENINYTTSSVNYETTATYTPDPTVSALMDQIIADESVILNNVVGYSPADLDGVWEDLRVDETNLGRAVTDSYLLKTGADIAFENAGGLRASIKTGDVTYGDIIGVLPYGNYIVTKQLTGGQVLEMLEKSIDIQIKSIAANESGIYDAWPDNSGSYLQVGGMSVEYNMANEYGKRIVSAKVGANALDKDKTYTVATNNFVAVSVEYPQIAQAKEAGEFCACDEALISYFEQTPEVISSSVTTPRMIKTSEQPTTQPTSQPESTQADTTVPQTSTDATSVTGEQSTTATSGAVATADETGAIQTGAQTTVIVLATMLLIAAGAFVVLRKRKENE